MNNKKIWLFSITVLAGIIFYLTLDTDSRDDGRSSGAAGLDDSSIAGQPESHPPLETISSRDPAPPLEPAIRDGLAEMLNTPSEEVEKEEANGAITFNLQGQFRTAPVATIDENGEIHIQEYSSLPPEPSP